MSERVVFAKRPARTTEVVFAKEPTRTMKVVFAKGDPAEIPRGRS